MASTTTKTSGTKCSRCNITLTGCKTKASQAYAKISTSTVTARGTKSGKLKKTAYFALRNTGVRGGAKVTWSKYGKGGGSKVVVKYGRLYVCKGIKKGTYKVTVKMSLATTSKYLAKNVYKGIKVVVR